MPRPAAQRARSRSTASKAITEANLLSSAVAVCCTAQSGLPPLSNKAVKSAIFSFCNSLQILFSHGGEEGGAAPGAQITEAVTQLSSVTDVLPTLTSLLRSVTPTLLGDTSSAGDEGCDDPACDDQACGPPPDIVTVLFIAFGNTTSMILSCEDDEARDDGFKKLIIDSQLVRLARGAEVGHLIRSWLGCS